MTLAAATHTPDQPGLFFPFRFSPTEREVWRAKEDLRCSQWAEKHLYIPRGAHVGPYRNEFNPYGVDIMDTFELPHTREVNVCAPPQATKTISAHCCIAKSIVYDPCEMMIVMPAREEVREEMDDRIIPMLQQSPELAKCLSDNPDDTSKYHVKLNNGAIIYTAWATSASKLARKAIKKIFFDETDKYPELVGKETNPFNLGAKRTRTFKNTYKIYRSSTPTHEKGPIWKFLHGSDVIKQWLVYCPDCGAAQIMDRKRGLRYPADKTAEEVLQGKLARYECEHCHSLWTDTKRNFATRCGNYTVTKGEKILYPRSVGYHLNGCAVADISLSEIAVKEIQAKTDPAAAIDLANDYDAEPYIIEKSPRKEEAILRLINESLPRGVVPADTARLIIKADTQQTGFMYQVLALGYSDNPFYHLVTHGFVESFDQLESQGEQEYQNAAGQIYRSHAGIIDSGGGTNPYKPKHSRTAEVYEFCSRNPFWRPLKGRRSQATPWNITRLEYYPARDGSKQPIPGGLNLYTINVTHYKNQLAGKLNLEPGAPGSITLHAGLNDGGPHSGQKYAAQLCAEYQDDHGYWECPQGKANHFWDCWVYGLALADIIGLKRIKRPNETEQKPKPVAKPQTPANNRQLPNWLLNRRR